MNTEHRPRGWPDLHHGRSRVGMFVSAAQASVLLLVGTTSTSPVRANPVPESIQGVPQQIVPEVPEVGLGNFSIQTGTAAPFGGSGSGGAAGPPVSGGGQTDSDALGTMLQQSWGYAAQQAAQGTGVNASALAATCVMESGCQNVNNSAGAQGVFQMFPAAYHDGLNTALAADPSLSSEIVQGSAGMDDPVTESIAASGYLLQANQALENAGISDPTVLDARSYYEFGPTAGPQIAGASDGDLMSSYVSNTALAKNDIPSTETVGQWRASVNNKIGNASGQPITA